MIKSRPGALVYKCVLDNGKDFELKAPTMCEMLEVGRKTCLENGSKWPLGVAVWERI